MTTETIDALTIQRDNYKSVAEQQKAIVRKQAAKSVTECPYTGAWRSFWLREFEKAKQLTLAI